MKKLIALLFVSVCSLAYSQTVPQAINYQGLARNSAGNPITSQTISLRFEILQGSATGPIVYTETQNNISTGSLGLFNTQIGKNGNLATVNWQTGSYVLRVGMDTLNGSSYVNLGTQTLASVPYALYAGSAPSPALSRLGNTLTIGSNTVDLPAQGGLQTLTAIPPNSISISGAGGNAIALPPITLNPAGATSITSSPDGYVHTINTPSVTLTGGAFGVPSGLLQIFGSSPNYSLIVTPSISYNPSTGILSLLSLIPGSPYVPPINYPIVPTLALVGTLLSVGPSTNAVDFSGITPWRTQTLSPTTVTLATNSASVGIGTSVPQSKLHVDGYTKLGLNAPPIQMAKLTGVMSSTPSIVSVISFSTITTAAKLLSVSVMVEFVAGSGSWIHAGNTTISNATFYWQVNGLTNDITVSGLTGATNLVGSNVRVLITYEP